MAAKTLSVSSLASAALFSRPRPAPPLRCLVGPHLPLAPRLRASPHFTSAAADLDPDEGIDTVEQLLLPTSAPGARGRIDRLMKLQRRADEDDVPGPGAAAGGGGRRRWFPYLDAFRSAPGAAELSSREVVELLEPHILEARRDRIRRAVDNRSYAVCLVVEGLTDFGNVSAAFRSADALGLQSVHVISCDNKRCRDIETIGM